MARRKTESEKRAERETAKSQYWQGFEKSLSSVSTLADAVRLATSGPGPDVVGRDFHINLHFFLANLVVPYGASAVERSMYLKLFRRLAAAREIGEETLARVEKLFKEATEPQRLYP